MRKHYLDNVRIIAVLLVLPYHAMLIFNDFDFTYYINGEPLASYYLLITGEWLMPALFVISGISAFIALQKRTTAQFLKERVSKLLVPFIAGLVFLLPIMSYFAVRFQQGYTGGYLEQWGRFFTTTTDFTGFDGGLTPGHLWFLLYLFVISLVVLPFMRAYLNSKKKLSLKRVPVLVLVLVCALPIAAYPLLIFAEKSFGEYLLWFLLGFYIFSNDDILEKLDKNRLLLSIIAVVVLAGFLYFSYADFYPTNSMYDIAFSRLSGWTISLALLGISRHSLNFKNKATSYLSGAAFAVYIFHQPLLVAIGYYVLMLPINVWLQVLLILVGTVTTSLACYEIFRRIPVTRFLFGIKAKK